MNACRDGWWIHEQKDEYVGGLADDGVKGYVDEWVLDGWVGR